MKIFKENSTTWSNHVRLVCSLYDLLDPLRLLKQQPRTKQSWRTLVKTKITAIMNDSSEAKLQRIKTYFNVQLLGLCRTPHPVISISLTLGMPTN